MAESRRQNPFAELLGEYAERMGSDHWHPSMDVYETEKAFVLRLEVAGVRSAELRVTVDGDVLRVRGRRQPPPDTDVQRLHQMEIAFGPFERSVRIPVPFEQQAVSAHLEDGFLCVTVPKRLPQKRRIEIESAEES